MSLVFDHLFTLGYVAYNLGIGICVVRITITVGMLVVIVCHTDQQHGDHQDEAQGGDDQGYVTGHGDDGVTADNGVTEKPEM